MDILLINLLFSVVGLFGLYFGGEKLVNGAVTIASTLRLRPQLIAITIVALGTSLPELFVSVNAVLKSSPDIAFGNVVGSNNCTTFYPEYNPKNGYFLVTIS